MKNLREMKNKKYLYILLPIVLISIFISSCDKAGVTKPMFTKRFLVVTTNNDNWTNSVIECDSLNMITLTNIHVYVDGVKSNIYAKRITVATNPKYK